MTRPADIGLWDELRSLQMYVRQEFNEDRIRLERPQEDEAYDILIEPPSEIISDARGTYMADRAMPITVQRWCSTYLAAVDAVERLERLFAKGVGQGRPRRIPVWKHAVPPATVPKPDPLVTPPDRFLKVDDLSSRILPSQTIGQYIAIIDLRLMGWRITHDHTDQLVNAVARPGGEVI